MEVMSAEACVHYNLKTARMNLQLMRAVSYTIIEQGLLAGRLKS